MLLLPWTCWTLKACMNTTPCRPSGIVPIWRCMSPPGFRLMPVSCRHLVCLTLEVWILKWTLLSELLLDFQQMEFSESLSLWTSVEFWITRKYNVSETEFLTMDKINKPSDSVTPPSESFIFYFEGIFITVFLSHTFHKGLYRILLAI
jgi:hypothetical protein